MQIVQLGSGEFDPSDGSQLRSPSEDPPLPDLVSDKSVRTGGVMVESWDLFLDGPPLFRDPEIDKFESCMDPNLILHECFYNYIY